jgi:hypothetical protein
MTTEPRSLSLSKGLEEVDVVSSGAEALASPSTGSGHVPLRNAEERR